MMEKTNVNGPDAHPAFTWLRQKSALAGGDIPRNFAKFLLDGNGRLVEYHQPEYDPKFIGVDIGRLCGNPSKDEL